MAVETTERCQQSGYFAGEFEDQPSCFEPKHCKKTDIVQVLQTRLHKDKLEIKTKS